MVFYFLISFALGLLLSLKNGNAPNEANANVAKIPNITDPAINSVF